jgi:hypothetical protein
MKISRQIWSFMGFALFTLFAYGAFWVWRWVSVSHQYSKQTLVSVLLLYWGLSLVGLIGMSCSSIAWIVAGVTRRDRAKDSSTGEFES